MVYWKIWLEVRNRFFVSLTVSILLALGLVVLFPFTAVIVNYAKQDMTQEEWVTVEKYTTDYRLFMDEGWFNETGFISLFAIVLTLGGVVTEVRRRTILLTLSLPVSRQKWIIGQGIFSVLLLLLIAGSCSLMILAGGWGMGKTFPLHQAFAGTLLMVAACLPWVGITLLISALTQDRLKAAIYSFLLWLVISPLERFPSCAVWMPESILKVLVDAPFPWQAILSTAAVTAASCFAAIRVFESRDY